jgi:hypothetical protein
VGRVGLDDVAGHQPVEQHAQVLFHRGRGELALQLLDERRNVEGLHLRELVQAVGVAPLRKPPRVVQVGFARVVVIDLGGEEFHHALRRLRGRREQPGGNRGGDEGGAAHCAIRTISASSTSTCCAQLTCCATGNVSFFRMSVCK